MRQRKRIHDTCSLPDSGQQVKSSDATPLENVRQAGEHFLAAGDEAISKAISRGDSEAFLIASRQAGGQ